MSHGIPLLLAAGLNELISVLVGLVFLVVWVLSQIVDAKKKQAQPPRRPGPMPPGPPGQPRAAQARPPAADPLRAQVDEFLRRAGRQAQPHPADPAPPPRRPAARRDEIEVLLADEAAEPAHQPLAAPLRPLGEAAATPNVPPGKRPAPRPPRRAAPSRDQTVAEHVAAHVDSAVQQIRKEVSRLGESVIAADRQFDTQLQQKFDHEVGSLRTHHLAGVQDRQTADKADTPASQIAAMLASPDGVRQAIVINEILRRPDERWL
jgi:hypothetical protein